jgi:hypothetical protein
MTSEAIFTEALDLPAKKRNALAQQLQLSLAPTAVPGPEGIPGDDPLFEQWLTQAAEYRQLREREGERFDAALV